VLENIGSTDKLEGFAELHASHSSTNLVYLTNHVSCRRCTTAAVLENIGSTDKLEGFDELKEEDQAMVRKALETKELSLPEDVAEAQEKVRAAGVEDCLVLSSRERE
jgi:hypothetical protein